MLHCHCSAAHFFQSSFNLCFPCLCFSFLQIKETGIGLFKYFGKTFENIMGFRRRTIRNEQNIPVFEKGYMVNL
uniref:Uncharacterized protein n=1 Tax=uncultured bacterium A1Q1_fos_560 TaxID=1256584 RepID=L7VXG1_9BACT|nr:hypothetical protein [uncultured bacterium A1Q1_fos_560]